MSILPTIFDLLAQTDSVPQVQKDVLSDVIPEYEGQSIIRPFQPSDQGRRAWNFGVANPGGNKLSIISSSDPYRLVRPLCEKEPFSFTHMTEDPWEESPLEDWDILKLINTAGEKYGSEASGWLSDAEAVSRWWVIDARRRWSFRQGE